MVKNRMKSSVFAMICTRRVKGEQFLDKKYRSIPLIAMANTKHCHSHFLLEIFFKQETYQNYLLLQVYNYTAYTPESKIRTRIEKRESEIGRERDRDKVRGGRKKKKKSESEKQREREEGLKKEERGG